MLGADGVASFPPDGVIWDHWWVEVVLILFEISLCKAK
jgi:hypothetical protein